MSNINALKQELAKLRRDLKWNREKIAELKQSSVDAKARIDELKANIKKEEVNS